MYFYFNPFSVQSCFAMCHYTSMHTHICTHVSDARAIYIMQIDFAEVKVLQQQNMLNVHHMHTWVCTVFKWNYEQHLYTHTLIPIINQICEHLWTFKLSEKKDLIHILHAYSTREALWLKTRSMTLWPWLWFLVHLSWRLKCTIVIIRRPSVVHRLSSLTFHFFDFSSETAEWNLTKLDRKQDLNILYQVCVFRADWKNEMAVLASDWLRLFRLLLWNRRTEFNETW